MLSNEEVTGTVDLWALGCIVFQMLVGKAPFKVRFHNMPFGHSVA